MAVFHAAFRCIIQNFLWPHIFHAARPLKFFCAGRVFPEPSVLNAAGYSRSGSG